MEEEQEQEREEREERDDIEFYLRTLRKKVDHQLKNPFQLAFANFTFQELYNWKNNVLQLDATSRLYAQRVDFLHSGTVHILGSVIQMEQQPAHPQATVKADKADKISSSVQEEQSIFERHLQSQQKLNGCIPKSHSNLLQWREIMRKRDTLPQLMLHQLALNGELMLNLVQSKEESKVYEQVFKPEEESVYLRMINFGLMQLSSLRVFQEIEKSVDDVDGFLMGLGSDKKKQNPRESFSIDSYMEFQFPCLQSNQSPRHDTRELSFLFPETRPEENQQVFPAQNDPHDGSEGDMLFLSQTFSLYSIDTRSMKKERKPAQTQAKKRENRKKNKGQQNEHIQFLSLNPVKEQILVLGEREERQDRYLQHKDYLHLKFIRYVPPYPIKPRNRGRRSLLKSSRLKPPHNGSMVEPQCSFELDPSDFNSNLPFTSFTGQHKRSQFKFKEAALPIKELKRRVREMRPVDGELSMSGMRVLLDLEDPLDIFISVLHIAAEDGLMVAP